MKLKTVLGIVAAVALGSLLPVERAAAAGLYCSSVGGNASGLQLTDVTFRSSNADDCYGIIGGNITDNGNGNNDGPAEVTTGFSGGGYGTGNFVGFASGGASAVLGGTTFSLTHTGIGATGTWTLTATGGLPGTFDIVFALKASNNYALYLFNDELFTVPQSGVGQLGAWTITFDNSGGRIPAVSHLVGFVRPGTPGGSGTPGGQSVVPEPASLLLLGSGLAAAARASRKKKAQKAE